MLKTQPKSSDARKVFRYYWRHARQYPQAVVGLFFAIPLTMLVNVFGQSIILAAVMSRLSQGDFQAHDIWGSFGWQIVLYALMLIIGHFTWRVVDHYMWHLEMNVQRDMAEEVFDKLLNQTADFHANNFVGSLVSNNSKLLGSYVRVADTTIYQVFPMISTITFAAIVMLFRAPLYSLILVILSSLFVVIAFASSRGVRKASTRFAASESRQTGYLADALTNNMAVKSFASGQGERKAFHKVATQTHDLLLAFSKEQKRQMLALGGSTRSITAAAFLVSVVSVMYFHADIGTMFLILSYTALIAEQLFAFGNNSLRNYSRAVGDTIQMVDTLALVPEIQDPSNPEEVRITQGLVAFEEVSFTHSGSDEALFNNFNVRVKPGEKVGLVGHSGSGKTTFTRLLLRFSDIQSGQITIDGQNITAITQDDLRRHIAYVPQEPLLFHRSIRDNIAYGQPDADEQAVVAVSKMAHAHEFVSTLPQGYDTLVGERGVKLSGGQRQRIAIARAMLKNAPILVLDEATSALDSESEVLIQDALWKLMEGRTAIVIAHRLSTIQKMDRIIVMDKGKIVEEGSHKELLAMGGAYAKLWAHQSGGFIEA